MGGRGEEGGLEVKDNKHRCIHDRLDEGTGKDSTKSMEILEVYDPLR